MACPSPNIPSMAPHVHAQLGDAALVRVALHAPTEGPLQLGSVLAGTLDFRASHEAAEAAPAAPKCLQVRVHPPRELGMPSSTLGARLAVQPIRPVTKREGACPGAVLLGGERVDTCATGIQS